MSKKKLYEIAHSRCGDKGEINNISLIPYNPENYELLRDNVSADMVKEHFKGIISGDVVRYEVPNIHALNYVLYGIRPGGVGAALDMDPHGKSLSSALLQLEIELPG